MSGRKAKEAAGSEAPAKKVSIWLTAEAVDLLGKFTRQFGQRGSQMAVLSRLVEKFATMPDAAKFAMLGWVPDGTGEAFAKALRDMADLLDGREHDISILRPLKSGRPHDQPHK